MGEIITMRLKILKEKIVGVDKFSGIIIRLFENTWKILGGSLSLAALLISFFSYRATVKEKELTTKLRFIVFLTFFNKICIKLLKLTSAS